MARPEQPRRKFVPVPIETTFQSIRKPSQGQKQRIGPNPELTPEPSPRSLSPVPFELRERRRFAPQLIESSRRARRVGDPGPATRPTDKTDITPHTKHIYAAKTRGRRRGDEKDDESRRPMPPTRRETEDERVQEYLLKLAAKEAERQIQEAALAAFPNSRAREGGVAHFYFRESSESENSPEATSPVQGEPRPTRVRRKSSNLGLTWWHKHMQDHVANLQDDEMMVDEPEENDEQEAKRQKKQSHHDSRSEIEDMVMHTDSELDMMDLPAPPEAMWITTNKSTPERKDSSPRRAIGESLMPLIQTDYSVSGQSRETLHQQSARISPQPIHETPSLYMSPAFAGRFADAPRIATSSQIPPETSFRNQGTPFGRPFGGLGFKAPAPKQKLNSPPMLGKDITFRRCPSPKQTKLEPDHPFAHHHAEERHRDASGTGGLWRGYCFKSESDDDYLVPAELHAPQMLATPLPPSTPGDPFASSFGASMVSEEPSSVFSSSDSSEATTDAITPSTPEHRLRCGEAKGLHMLHGLDERLKREKMHSDLDEKIANEFDDAFITQVYNYLSLGYPATARAYDEELSKISHIGIDDLEKDDERQMAQGHLVEVTESIPEEQRCPRWRALKKYVTEWARQHPNLDNLDPLAWGVRERRGSWAI